jgi:hypothetical protein
MMGKPGREEMQHPVNVFTGKIRDYKAADPAHCQIAGGR